jgi:cell migration-inducing and hyaluronan-binding protein
MHYNPRVDPADRNSAAVPATFTGLQAWKNRYHGAWMRGSNLSLKDAVFSDNQTGAAFPGNEAFLDNAFAVGETANMGNPESWETKRPNGAELPTPWETSATITGFDFYDGRVGVRGGLFANFVSDVQRPAGALGRVHDNRFAFHNGNFVKGLSFASGTDRLYFETPLPDRDGDHSLVVKDEDGTLTGTAGAVVTTKEPFLTTDACRLREVWNAYSCGDNPQNPGVAASPYASFLTEITMGSNLSSFKPLHLRRSWDGVAQRLVGTYPEDGSAHTNLVANREYDVEFNGGAAALPKETMYVLWNSQGKTLTVDVPVPNNSFRVERYGSVRDPASSMDALRARTSSGYYYDANAKIVTLRLVAGTNTWEELKIERTDI